MTTPLRHRISGFDLTHVAFEGKGERVPTRLVPARQRSVPRIPRGGAGATTTREEDDRCTGFPRWVLTEAGLDPTPYRGTPLQRRLPACLRALKVASERDARLVLMARPQLLSVAVSALLIGVTEFFRDPAVFDDLRATVLPALAESPGVLRAWSAGCSSGGELYSLAILFADAGLLQRSELLGTDCRSDGIAEAVRAAYPPAALAALPEGIRERHFETDADRCRPSERIRRSVRWKVSDLSKHLERGPWDLIVCRNILIYLNPEAASRLVDDLVASLRPRGYLVLGKAEAPSPASPVVRVGRCIYQRGDPSSCSVEL